MNKNNEFNIDNIKVKINKLIGRILLFIIAGVAGFKLNNILSNPSNFFKLFYTNIYKNFHSYSYMSNRFWTLFLVFYLILTAMGIFFFSKIFIKKEFSSFLNLHCYDMFIYFKFINFNLLN